MGASLTVAGNSDSRSSGLGGQPLHPGSRAAQSLLQGRPSVSRCHSALVVGRATGTQQVTASLLQVPVKHLQHFVTLQPWSQP